MPLLFTMGTDGIPDLHLHFGQGQAWESKKRFVLVLAGTQGGKTSFGVWWLHREIQQCGPGEYLIATPTFPLLDVKALPEFMKVFQGLYHLGKLTSSPSRKFTYHGGLVTVRFGHAGDSESLEAATYKAAWLDEAGQAGFKQESWEAILRRLAINRGRCLLTTTPYRLGWLKRKLFDPWKQAGGNHPEIDVINFRSIDNPAFPRQEYEDRKRDLPSWKFRMFYDGVFERPAGLIYDCFDHSRHTCPRFTIPAHWPRYVGLDFGGVNTAAVFLAEEATEREGPVKSFQRPLAPARTGKLYLYKVYGPCGSRTAAQHAREILKGEPGIPFCVGGSLSEGQWRDEFAAGGLPVRPPPIGDVEVGIQRVWGAINKGELMVFDDLHELIDDLQSYSRETDDAGEVTEKIADKDTWHRLDALRYICSHLKGGALPPGSFRLERL